MGAKRRTATPASAPPDPETLLRELEQEMKAPSPFHPETPPGPAAMAERASDAPWRAAPPASPEAPLGGGEGGVGLSEKQALRSAWRELAAKLPDVEES